MRDLPAELLAMPFTLSMSDAAGVSRAQVRGRRCRQLLHGVYIGAEVKATVEIMAIAVALQLPPGAMVGATTGAYLHGADVRRWNDLDIDVVVAQRDQVRRKGLRVQEALVEPGDVVEVMGVPVLSPTRIAFDLARNRDLIEAVVGIDAMLNRGGCKLNELRAYIDSHAGWRGIRWARAAIEHAEPKAESPMESRQRMRLVLGGLPRPTAQVRLEIDGLVVARLDHGYEEWKVAPEYDGSDHSETWRYDNERQQIIRDLGWWHRRYTSLLIGAGWPRMVAEVRAALINAGWRP